MEEKFDKNKEIQTYITHFSSLNKLPSNYYKKHHHFNLTSEEKYLAEKTYLEVMNLCKEKADLRELREFALKCLTKKTKTHSLYYILNEELYDFLMLLAD